MRKLLINPFSDEFFLIGLTFLIGSLGSSLTWFFNYSEQDFFVHFFGTHFFSFVYLLFLLANNKARFGGAFKFHSRRNNIVTLLLWTVSAYTLNIEMSIFSESVPWLSAWICVYTAALLLIALLRKLGTRWIDYVLICIISLAVPFHFYQTLMTFTLYPVTLVSFWLFGISLHALVPLFSFIICLKILRSYLDISKRFHFPLRLSLLFVGTLIFVFVWKWNGVLKQTNLGYVKIEEPYKGNDLPAWCTLGQNLPDDAISNRLLGGSNIYVTQDELLKWNRIGMQSDKKHDPLVLIASLFCGHMKLTFKERKRIATVLYNKRHEAEWKLWSDKDLVTESIQTEVQLFPAERMAYTEKTFDIKNTHSFNRNKQEALYTFFVPDGSVVTSASLWINGKEEHSYLTTKTKANSAYKAIVGRERRDPLLVHWQEGNRVTARIFPVTPDTPRKFKLGITTPLTYEDGQLIYQNVDFKGPSSMATTEEINLRVEGDKKVALSSPLEFSWDMNKYNFNGLYYSDWALSIEAPPLNEAAFSFNDKSFRLLDLAYDEKPIDAYRKVYLDVNKSWTKRMFKNILAKCAANQIYMLDGERIVNVTQANAMKHFKKMNRKNFSVFPIYKIADPESALLISNNNHITPVIDDFKKTPFGEKLSTYMELSAGRLVVLNLGEQDNQFLNSLVELKSIIQSASSYDSFIKNETVLIPKALDGAVAIGTSKTQIVETMGNELFNAAPDHILRLHSYNALMKKIGKDFSKRKDIEDRLISIAEEAHILSPISSMIVLESQTDYDRFDIKRSDNSLGNASMNKSGSVPEPHEWVLIIILICSLLFLHVKSSTF